MSASAREEVLKGLRWLQRDWFDGDEHEEYDPVWRKLADAIAYLDAAPVAELKPATVASKRLGDGPETHYVLGPQRATRAEAEADLRRATQPALVCSVCGEALIVVDGHKAHPCHGCAIDHLNVGAEAGASAAEALAEDYAKRFGKVAEKWEEEAGKIDPTGNEWPRKWGLVGRANGLHEAARMLRDKENR